MKPKLAVPTDVLIVHRMPHASPTATWRHPWCDADCPWHSRNSCTNGSTNETCTGEKP